MKTSRVLLKLLFLFQHVFLTGRMKLLLLPILLTLLVSACDGGPSGIENFDVRPFHTCDGDTVTLTWEATGPVNLSASPTSNVNFSETGDLPATHTTTATMHNDDAAITATSGAASKSVDVPVFSTGDPHNITAIGVCGGTGPVWHVNWPMTEWSNSVRVGEVVNTTLGETVTIVHGGETVSLPSFDSTSNFLGTPFSGDWDFSMSILSNPCGGGTEQGDVPAITIQATLVCNGP